MDVAAYLKELLYQEHVVYVSGLGTFITRKSAGIYNQEQQRFYPPKNSIDFVEEEKQDEALEKYISEHKNISTTAAKYFIEKFVEQLKSKADSQNIAIKEVLFPAEEEAKPENTVAAPAYNMENFGLPSVSFRSLKNTVSPAENEFVPKETDAELFYQEASDNFAETKPKRNTSFWASVLLLLAMSLLGCYALYLYYPDLFTRFTESKTTGQTVKKPVVDTITKNTTTLPQGKTDTLATKTATDTSKVEVIQPATTIAKAESIQKQATKDSAFTEASADPDLVAKSPYEMIGASFKTVNGAKAFLNQLKAKGMHRAKILNNTTGKQKLITFGSFKDIETAKAALEKLRIKDPQSEAYIQHYIIK